MKRLLKITVIVALLTLVTSCGSRDMSGLTYEEASAIGEERYSYSFKVDGYNPTYADSYEIANGMIILHNVWRYNPVKLVWERETILVYPVSTPLAINNTRR